MKLIKGKNLTIEQRQAVLRRYVYRLTHENRERALTFQQKPAFALRFVSDSEWIDEHAFYVNKNGELSESRRYAEPAFLAD